MLPLSLLNTHILLLEFFVFKITCVRNKTKITIFSEKKKIPTKIGTLVNWVKGSLATLRTRVLATENL